MWAAWSEKKLFNNPTTSAADVEKTAEELQRIENEGVGEISDLWLRKELTATDQVSPTSCPPGRFLRIHAGCSAGVQLETSVISQLQNAHRSSGLLNKCLFFLCLTAFAAGCLQLSVDDKQLWHLVCLPLPVCIVQWTLASQVTLTVFLTWKKPFTLQQSVKLLPWQYRDIPRLWYD